GEKRDESQWRRRRGLSLGAPASILQGRCFVGMAAAGSGSRRFKCPPFPPILDAINQALQDPMGDDRNVRHALRADEALSLAILRYANSAWFTRRQKAQTVDEALTVVGFDGVRSLVMTEFVADFFPDWGEVEEFLWEHALAGGIAAARQRPGGGKATEELYLC